MPIKTGRVRRAYDDSIRNQIICPNMLLMSIAYINNQLNYNPKLNTKHIAKYQNQRTILARCAIEHNISKGSIREIIDSLSADRYPSDNQISSLVRLIEREDYSFVETVNDISNKDMLLKTDEEINQQSQQRRIDRDRIAVQTEKEFTELRSYVEREITRFTLSPDMVNKLMGLHRKEYSYPVILQCCKFYRDNITKSVAKTYFDNAYDKFCYILSIVKRKLPDTIQIIERRKNEEVQFWDETAQQIVNGDCSIDEMIYFQCDKYPDTVYYGRNDYVRHQLLSAIERLSRK